MKKQNKFLAASVISLCILLGTYAGAACLITSKEMSDYNESKKMKVLTTQSDTVRVVYEGLIFKNMAEVDNYINDLKEGNVSRWFNWSQAIPDFFVLILGACSFGLLGSTLRIIKEHVFGAIPLENSNYIALPVLGFLSGFISIGISYLLPNIFLNSKSLVNPVGLILFSLFFGFFIKEFLERISNQLFKNQNQKNNEKD